MRVSFRRLFQDIVNLGSGELVGRLSSIGTVVFLGHRYGVVVLGAYALAQTVTQYLPPLIDFGLRHVGARLLALYPLAAQEIVARVQKRRWLMAGAVVPFILVYSIFVKLPAEMKIFLAVFSATGTLYAFSLDWAAWGREKLQLMGWARAFVPLSIFTLVALARPDGQHVLWWVAMGNALGFLGQGAICRVWWTKQRPPPGPGAAESVISEALEWRRTVIMGLAWLCNLAFNSIDILMLGLLSNPEQVGLYSASYRILNQVLATYYLLTQVLYPRFARHGIEDRVRMLRLRILLPLVGAGILISVTLSFSRRMVLTIMFGHQFLAACPLLLLLAWSIPLDFMTSYLSNAFIAWGMEKKILVCTGIAAGSNVLLNLVVVPGFGARGAAIDTLVSYAVFLTALGVVGRTAKELARPPARATSLSAVIKG